MNGAHIDLFTGLGGFTLAAQWAGFRTVVMCEVDPFRRAGLEKAWPGIPIIKDVREFDGREWQGASILTAGVPCQPASRAGMQRGARDDRWLWPEAIRIVSEARPTWVLLENPPGIADVGLDGVLADLETLDYEVGAVDIPACGVDGPHRRHRLWIMAHCHKERPDRKPVRLCAGRSQQTGVEVTGGAQGGMADGDKASIQQAAAGRPSQARGTPVAGRTPHGMGDGSQAGALPAQQPGQWDGPEPATADCLANLPRQPLGYAGLSWQASPSLWLGPRFGFRRFPPVIHDMGNGIRRELLAALGDSIVPQVAYEILKAIAEAGE